VKEDVLHQFGRRMRVLRKRMKLTQEQLANRAHISLKYVQSLEGKNPQNPSLEVLRDIADGLEMSLSKLLKFEK
jgi:transcriptional regulator with XRE-family HTH domain